MRISDWSSDVCSSDLPRQRLQVFGLLETPHAGHFERGRGITDFREVERSLAQRAQAPRQCTENFQWRQPLLAQALQAAHRAGRVAIEDAIVEIECLEARAVRHRLPQ